MPNRNEELIMFAKMTIANLNNLGDDMRKNLPVGTDNYRLRDYDTEVEMYREFLSKTQINIDNLALREVDTKL
jgi:hypothetical protein